MPRTFQGRLTLGFISVVSLTLLLVGPAVIIRLDDYFLRQEQLNLEDRTTSTLAVIVLAARNGIEGPIVTPNNRSDPERGAFFTSDIDAGDRQRSRSVGHHPPGRDADQ